MKGTVLKYFYQYSLATLMFLIVLLLERSLLLVGLNSWLLFYFLMRKVSFKIILLLAVFSDLVGMRMVGLSLLVLAIVLLISQYIRMNKLQFWLVSLIGVLFVQYVSGGQIGWGLFLSTTMMLIPFIFLSPLKGIISGRRI